MVADDAEPEEPEDADQPELVPADVVAEPDDASVDELEDAPPPEELAAAR